MNCAYIKLVNTTPKKLLKLVTFYFFRIIKYKDSRYSKILEKFISLCYSFTEDRMLSQTQLDKRFKISRVKSGVPYRKWELKKSRSSLFSVLFFTG